jgi:hypothetical protein
VPIEGFLSGKPEKLLFKNQSASWRKKHKQAGYVPILSPLQIEAKMTASRDFVLLAVSNFSGVDTSSFSGYTRP